MQSQPEVASGVDARISAARTAGVALFLLTALNLFNFIDRYILPGVQPLVQKEFRVNDAQIGFLTTAFFVTYMCIAPLTGWIADFLPRKPLIIIGALLWSAATLFTARVHSYETLLIRHAIVGIGEATFSIYAPALLADFYPERDRNRVLSIFYVTIPVGGALGYLTGGVLGQHYGWRMPFFIAALPGVLIALGFWLFVREPQRGSADSLAPTLDRATFFGLFENPAFWAATLGLAMWTFAVGGISTFLPTFFVRFANMSVAKAGTVTGALTVVDGLLGTIIGGWLGQIWLRRNHRALYLVSAWGSILAIPAAALVFFGPQPLFLPAAFVAEFFLFLGTGPLNAAIVNSVAAPIRATAISVNLFVIHVLGDAFSPTLIGKISDATDLRIGLSITLITLTLSGVILFAGAKCAPMLDETTER
jgi:MFS transporter, Spinster family, sphingosine-1-phosphate transporter